MLAIECGVYKSRLEVGGGEKLVGSANIVSRYHMDGCIGWMGVFLLVTGKMK